MSSVLDSGDSYASGESIEHSRRKAHQERSESVRWHKFRPSLIW